MLLSFRCSDYFVQVLFMSRTTVFYKAKPKAHITYIASEAVEFNVAGNLVMVVKFTFQNPRHFSAQGREESLKLYSIL